MCLKFFNKIRMVDPIMSPAPCELAPLPEVHRIDHLAGIVYQGGFQPFSQVGGYYPHAMQTTTPDALGLVQGQMMWQPLVAGDN